VLHGADAADEKPQQLAQARLIESATDAPRRRTKRDRAWDIEQQRTADASQIAAEIA
jgi:hypothetical protein